MQNYTQVTVTCKNLRSWGRQALSGYWSTAVLGTLIFALLTILPVFILKQFFDSDVMKYVSNLYGLLMSGLLALGYTSFLLAVFRRKPTSPVEVFYGFEQFGKSFGLFLVMNLFIMLWTLLFIIPGIIASFRYAMAFYLLADNPNIGILEAIRESKSMMQGNKAKFFFLELSFFGWILLATLTAGIGFLWVMPYMTASSVGFYEVANGNLRPKRESAEQKLAE